MTLEGITGGTDPCSRQQTLRIAFYVVVQLAALLCFGVVSASGQSAPVPPYQLGVFPPDSVPVIPPGDDVIIYIHGGPGSRLEEASDLVKPLMDAGLKIGKRYTVISFDQPTQGYSTMIDPDTIVAPTLVECVLGICADTFPPVNAAAPAPTPMNVIVSYYPLLASSEEFIAGFLDRLNQTTGLYNHRIYIMGGSTGGALTLRMGHRPDPWITKIVAWNPASVWTTYTHDALKGIAVSTAHVSSEEKEGPTSRAGFFKGVYGPMLNVPVNGGLPIIGETGLSSGRKPIQPNPEEWYRGNRDNYYPFVGNAPYGGEPASHEWLCKWQYIAASRLEMEEVYNPAYRRWHFRLGADMLTFSFFNDDWSGPGNTAGKGGKPANYEGIIKPTLLAAGQDDDWDEGLGLHWENRWRQTLAMAPLMKNTPGSTLFILNTGHSIHNERPQFFAQNIVKFLSGNEVTTGPLKFLGVVQPTVPAPAKATAAGDEVCQQPFDTVPGQPSPFPTIPRRLLDNPNSATFLMQPAILGGFFSDGSDAGHYSLRLRPELRTVALAKSPALALGVAAAFYFLDDTIMGNAFADLSVTGRDVYDAFRSHPPTDDQIKTVVTNILPLAIQLKGAPQAGELESSVALQLPALGLAPNLKNLTPDQNKLTKSVTMAKTRAYQVAWALRNPDTKESYQFRPTLGWIAVSGEDDPPGRPVNVPSGIPVFGPEGKQISSYPQNEIQVAMCPGSTTPPFAAHYCMTPTGGVTPGAVAFKIRYTVAGLPGISDVNPPSIPVGTTTPVTIRGANLVDVKSVSPSNFSFTVNSPTQITVNMPKLQPGVYPIEVRTGAGYSSETINLTVRPIITGISPTSGPKTGGTNVTISGVGLPPFGVDMPVSIGNIRATAKCGSGSCFLAMPAYAAPATVDVIGTVAGASSAPSASDKFSYTENAELVAIQVPDHLPEPCSAEQTYATISLNGNAPAGGAAVTLTSDMPGVVDVPKTVTILGSNVFVPLTFLPTPKDESVNLTATYDTYGGRPVTATLPVPAWPPVSLSLVALDRTQANVTVTINTIAGASVSLQPNDPSALSLPTPPPFIATIPVGSCKATFPIIGHPSVQVVNHQPIFESKTVIISASYPGGTASLSTRVPFQQPCAKKCSNGTYLNPQNCQCESGPPPQ
jgi:pimeloyl-ACP methyl ester carboxylesterase